MFLSKERREALKTMLETRRREIQSEVDGRLAEQCQEANLEDVALDGDEADIRADIEFALIQMKEETVRKIDDALTRLDEGSYGVCFECGEEIREERLRVLPFAVRCKDCEDAREEAERHQRILAQGQRPFSDF